MTVSYLERLHQLKVALSSASDYQGCCIIFMDWLKTAVDPRFAAVFRRFEDGPFYLASFYGEGALHGETMPSGSDPWEWLELKNIPLPRGYRYTLPIGGPEKQNGILAVISARRGKKLEEEKLLLDQALASLLVFGHGEPAGGVLVGDEQYRTLFENAPIGIGVVDTSGTFLAFNDAILKPGGYTREDIRALGNVAALYYDNRDREQVLGLLHKQGFVHQFPVRFKRRDGKPYDALLTLRPIQIEGKRCIQALVEDVTERKCAENSLRESEEKYRAFVEQLPAVVYVDKLDGRGTTTFVSPQIEDLFGLTVEEWLKGDMSTWLDMVHPEDRQMALDAYHGLKEPGGQYDVEYRVIRRDKRQVWIQDRGGVLKSASGELYLHGVLVDITERKTRERELEAEAMLAQALGETLELQPLLERLLEAAQFAIPAADKGSILLAEPDGSLCIHALHGYKDARLLGLSFSADSGYAARAALERKPLLFSGVRSQPSIRYDEEIEDAKDIHSAIAAPLMIQDRVIGVISLDATEIDAFTEEDLRLLVKFATSAALIVERANLFEETRRRVEEAAALLETSQALNTLDMKSVLRTVGERAKAIFAAEGCRIFLLEPDGETLRCVLALQEYGEAFQDLTIKMGQGITGSVAASGQAEIVNSMQDDPRAVHVPGTPEEEEAIIFAPLSERGRTLGVISVRRVGRERSFGTSDLELLKAFASLAASAVSNARLFDDTQKRLAELSVLHRSSQNLLVSGFNAEETYAGVHEAVMRVMPTDAFVIVLEDDAQGDYHAVYRFDKGVQYSASRVPRGEGLSGHVISEGKTLLVDDYHAREDIQAVHFGYEEYVRSILAIPLMRSGKPFGMISVQSYQPGMYDESHREVLETIAAQFASSIEIARLFEETQQRLRELETLQEVSAALRQARSVQDMIPILVKYAVRAAGAKFGSIYLREEMGGDWISQGWVAADGRWTRNPTELRHKPGEGVTGWVGERSDLYVIEDWRSDPVVSALSGELDVLKDVHSGISLPLSSEERVIGVMHIWYGARHVFTDGEKDILTAIADMAGSALQRARLHEETTQRLNHLTVLRDVDRVIASSFDLRFILNTLLSHAVEQLRVDAASILLFNPNTNMLEHGAGRGFRSDLQSTLQLRLGESLAGRAALTRKPIAISDLEAANEGFGKSEFLEGEDFKAYYAHPLVTKGKVNGVLEVFHRAPLFVTPDWTNLFETLSGQAAIAIDNVRLFENLERSNFELILAYDKTIEGWSKALDMRDRETEGHTRRVTDLTLKLARRFGLTRADIVHLRRGALLHDIGKIGIPDHILLKPGNLTEEEWVIMRQHPQFAYDMLSSVEYLRPALDIPYCHHEKWDGSGYPRGLKGEEIPLSARIFAVADVWDALTSHRPYRPAWNKDEALDYIRNQAGKHFDPKVVEAFFDVIEQ